MNKFLFVAGLMSCILGLIGSAQVEKFSPTIVTNEDTAAFLGLHAWSWKISKLPADTSRVTIRLLKNDKIIGQMHCRVAPNMEIKVIYSDCTGQCTITSGAGIVRIGGLQFEGGTAYLAVPVEIDGKKIFIAKAPAPSRPNDELSEQKFDEYIGIMISYEKKQP